MNVRGLIKRLFGIEREVEAVRSETCEHCTHLYYNNDGSVGCDSPHANVCIRDNTRMFKELDHTEA